MKTILIIDDNISFLENVSEFLEIEGYQTLMANNGKRGLELALEYLPDLIICDVLMHEIDGHEVLRLLLNSTKTFKIPFVFSTSLSENIDRIETLKLGADDYLVKPYEMEGLLKIVETWVPKESCSL